MYMFRITTLFSLFAFVGLNLPPVAWAVSPPPDGGYPNNTTAEGTNALLYLGTGTNNTAVGFSALQNNSSGNYNTAVGALALISNNFGGVNTACGYNALSSNTIGMANTAMGKDALAANTSGSVNTATGDVALVNNTSGGANTADGVNALAGNTTGSDNTAGGFAALMNNTTGTNNTASGANALLNNSTGSNNIALGYMAGSNLTTGINNIDIGDFGVAAESNTIRIGTNGNQTTTFIAGIRGVAVGGAQAVVVDRNGQLGVKASSARFKEAIKPMDKTSEVILSLHPVSFRYKKELDPQGAPQFGLIAEEVAKVDRDLVVTDKEGKPFSVRYEEVNAMLLNEFLKEHHKVEALEETVSDLKAALKEQATQIQQVSRRIEATVPAPEVVSNE